MTHETDKRHLQKLVDLKDSYESWAMAALRDQDLKKAERMMGISLGLDMAIDEFELMLEGERKAADAARRQS